MRGSRACVWVRATFPTTAAPASPPHRRAAACAAELCTWVHLPARVHALQVRVQRGASVARGGLHDEAGGVGRSRRTQHTSAPCDHAGQARDDARSARHKSTPQAANGRDGTRATNPAWTEHTGSETVGEFARSTSQTMLAIAATSAAIGQYEPSVRT